MPPLLPPVQSASSLSALGARVTPDPNKPVGTFIRKIRFSHPDPENPNDASRMIKDTYQREKSPNGDIVYLKKTKYPLPGAKNRKDIDEETFNAIEQRYRSNGIKQALQNGVATLIKTSTVHIRNQGERIKQFVKYTYHQDSDVALQQEKGKFMEWDGSKWSLMSEFPQPPRDPRPF